MDSLLFDRVNLPSEASDVWPEPMQRLPPMPLAVSNKMPTPRATSAAKPSAQLAYSFHQPATVGKPISSSVNIQPVQLTAPSQLTALFQLAAPSQLTAPPQLAAPSPLAQTTCRPLQAPPARSAQTAPSARRASNGSAPFSTAISRPAQPAPTAVCQPAATAPAAGMLAACPTATLTVPGSKLGRKPASTARPARAQPKAARKPAAAKKPAELRKLAEPSKLAEPAKPTDTCNLAGLPKPPEPKKTSEPKKPAEPRRKAKSRVTTPTDCNTAVMTAAAPAIDCPRLEAPTIGDRPRLPSERPDFAMSDSSADQPPRDSLVSSLNFPFVTLSDEMLANERDVDIDRLRDSLASKKWIISKWIKLKEDDLRDQLLQSRQRILSAEKQEQEMPLLDQLLQEKSRRQPNDIRKGLCCYRGAGLDCARPSMPFSRHCQQHMLCNLNQTFYERCAAFACPATRTQCENAVFSLVTGEQLCELHREEKTREEPKAVLAENSDLNKPPAPTKRKSKAAAARAAGATAAGPAAPKQPRRPRKKKNENVAMPLPANHLLSNENGAGLVPTSVGEHLAGPAGNALGPVSNILNCNLPSMDQFSTFGLSQYANVPVTITPTTACFTAGRPIDQLFSQSTLHPDFIGGVGVGPLCPMMSDPRHASPGLLNLGDIPHAEDTLVSSFAAELPQISAQACDEQVPFGDSELSQVLDNLPADVSFSELFPEKADGRSPRKPPADLAQVLKEVRAIGEGTDVGSVDPLGGYFADHPLMQAPSLDQVEPSRSLNLNDSDILGLAGNIMGSLTTEQQLQFNGLIDGAIASCPLTGQPTIKTEFHQQQTHHTLHQGPPTPTGDQHLLQGMSHLPMDVDCGDLGLYSIQPKLEPQLCTPNTPPPPYTQCGLYQPMSGAYDQPGLSHLISQHGNHQPVQHTYQQTHQLPQLTVNSGLFGCGPADGLDPLLQNGYCGGQMFVAGVDSGGYQPVGQKSNIYSSIYGDLPPFSMSSQKLLPSLSMNGYSNNLPLPSISTFPLLCKKSG